jgi:glutaredoxin 3
MCGKIPRRMIRMTEVKVFSTPTCPWCNKAKDFLKEKNVEFKDLNVQVDEAARNEMFQNSGQMGVPQISIGDKWIIGFNPAEIEAALSSDRKED